MNVNATRRHVGGLRAVRQAFGVTQAELAQMTGVDRSLISRVERGVVPSWPRLRRAASMSLGVPEEVLFPTESRKEE